MKQLFLCSELICMKFRRSPHPDPPRWTGPATCDRISAGMCPLPTQMTHLEAYNKINDDTSHDKDHVEKNNYKIAIHNSSNDMKPAWA